ncbi:hypothetical protein DI09_40p20 [Mitosporidium daphniae]|uniref:Dolichyl-phosphate-mannose--protein mannosyltransferase n=1 Tax=Mitosporidium daphniae TaxID=1485682 RepID=A0A098VU30_9MICR|nr:uncharacterized protein DI09_40p20 [Mitosporidium daphniae]KGG51216.1 hypothetical protein DI09_40p20 [Mitosporidium daphniae]|eukprot:XP_013237661.1 uncharacterized protein DI09_40p20 [Mitosporidium daphniae]
MQSDPDTSDNKSTASPKEEAIYKLSASTSASPGHLDRYDCFFIFLLFLPSCFTRFRFISVPFDTVYAALVIIVGHPIKLCSYSKYIPVCLAADGRSYPQIHLDGKVSSGGTAVFGTSSLESPSGDSVWVLNFVSGEANGDLFANIYHPKTDSYLLTHDVASPLTLTNMEVTTTKDKFNPHCVWKLLNVSLPVSSKSFIFKIVNNVTGTVLIDFERNLPEWGRYQREISSSSKVLLSGHPPDRSCWSMYPETYRRGESPKTRSFWLKFVEHQILFYKFNMLLDGNHPAASDPISWPLHPGINKGVSFWDDIYLNKHIYLIGNPLAWILCVLALMVSLFALLVCFKSSKETLLFLPLGAWAFHYLPYFLCRTKLLYLHYYLPAFSFSALAVGCMLQYFFRSGRASTLTAAILGLCAALIYCAYLKISLFNNGVESLSNEILDFLSDSSSHPLSLLLMN